MQLKKNFTLMSSGDDDDDGSVNGGDQYEGDNECPIGNTKVANRKGHANYNKRQRAKRRKEKINDDMLDDETARDAAMLDDVLEEDWINACHHVA